MKKTLFFIALVLFLPSILAMNLHVQQISPEGVLVGEIDQPAIIDLKLTNNDRADNFTIVNFAGFSIEPQNVFLKEDESRIIHFKVYPKEDFDYRGYYIFKYTIFNSLDQRIDKEFLIKMMDFQNAFEIGAGELNPESNSIEIFIENKENFVFNDLSVKFSSAFFELERKISLQPNEKKFFEVKLNKEDFSELTAGFYTLNAEITSSKENANIEGIIKFTEKDIVISEKKEYGFIVASKIIKKENQGNVIVESQTTLKKNIISRLFTSFSPVPDSVNRDGFDIYYDWNYDIKPGETFEIVVKTNWLFPLIIILLIVSVIVAVKQYNKKNLVIKKRVSFVKTKSGDFALKINLFLHARKYIEKVNVIDRLPPLVKLYEKFGSEKPIRADEKTKKIEWAFEKLEEGETRTLNYVIYSKVGVLGKFALPEAMAVFERDGKIQESHSNKTFFVAEPKEKLRE